MEGRNSRQGLGSQHGHKFKQLTDGARGRDVTVVHLGHKRQLWWGEAVHQHKWRSWDSRIILRHFNIDLKHAALVRTSGRTWERRAPLENVGLVRCERYSAEILAREVCDLGLVSALFIKAGGWVREGTCGGSVRGAVFTAARPSTRTGSSIDASDTSRGARHHGGKHSPLCVSASRTSDLSASLDFTQAGRRKILTVVFPVRPGGIVFCARVVDGEKDE